LCLEGLVYKMNISELLWKSAGNRPFTRQDWGPGKITLFNVAPSLL
jgi:hypothetical protein